MALYTDASTGLVLLPVSTITVADLAFVDLVILAAKMHAPRQHLLDLRALPLVDQDTIFTIDVQIVSMEALAACVDTTSRSGLLTITGCGRAYYGHIVLGSPTGISVRPNPATETVFLDIDAGVKGEINVALVDALGRIIAEQRVYKTSHKRISDHIVFDLTGVASGMHAVVITTPTERRYVQIVVGK
ncbi:MAG: T9SS type A sorting domain-containing protein [Bacteroidetes bacterium]|nr:T9SS type A sorting domain-containing protein [Bacteroidota bacterium]